MTRPGYGLKTIDPYSSHVRVVRVLESALAGVPAPRILDVGCAGGLIKRTADVHAPALAGAARWTGIDHDPAVLEEAARAGMEVHGVDLARELSTPLPGPFDAVVMADVLEHFAAPEVVLARLLRSVCGPQTVVIVSLPNVANLHVRVALAAGRFEYDPRGGILDRAHLRFYTRRSALRLLREAGLRVERCWPTPVPLYRLAGERLGVRLARAAQHVIFAVTRAAPTLLGYQFVFEARLAASRT